MRDDNTTQENDLPTEEEVSSYKLELKCDLWDLIKKLVPYLV
jgi:hypothetical protein